MSLLAKLLSGTCVLRRSGKYRRQLRHQRALRLRPGISLAEVVVSTLLIGLLMVGALSSVGGAARTATAATQGSDGLGLARQLLEEITVLPYDEPTQSANFGPESGETSTPGVRSGFDDMDDYLNWNDSPPKGRNGVALAGFTAWLRTADVEKIDDKNYGVRSDNSSDKGLRRITVTVTSPTGRITQLQAYRAKIAGSLQPQGINQTLVTWVGVSLQAGSGKPVYSGVSLINHAADQ